MTKESARLLMEYRAAGLEYVCPAKAAPVLGCDPYSLNIAAKLGRMPEGSCYFAGRNLRVSVRWLMEMAGFRAGYRVRGGMLPNGAIMAAACGGIWPERTATRAPSRAARLRSIRARQQKNSPVGAATSTGQERDGQ